MKRKGWRLTYPREGVYAATVGPLHLRAWIGGCGVAKWFAQANEGEAESLKEAMVAAELNAAKQLCTGLLEVLGFVVKPAPVKLRHRVARSLDRLMAHEREELLRQLLVARRDAS